MILTIIGTASDHIQTRRGDLVPAIRLFYTTDLENGTGQYGASKSVPSDRLADIGGMPEIGCSYDVSFNQWGGIGKMKKVDTSAF